MIIKSMSRKTATFSQLVRYMNSKNEGQKYDVYQHIYSTSAEELTRDFESNSEHIKQRKNGVYMYHEILSISKPKGLNIEKQKEKLYEIGKEYARRRAPDSMIYGVMHNDATHHLHYHFLISANKVDEAKKHRLSKSSFDTMKRDFESYVLTSFPELEQKPVITAEKTKKRDRPARGNKGGETTRRLGKRHTRTEKTKQVFTQILETVTTREEFFERLQASNFEFYARGQTLGVQDKTSGYKYRLKTLGLESDFYELSERLEAREAQTTTKDTEPKKPAPEKPQTRRTARRQGNNPHQESEPAGGQRVGKKWDTAKTRFKEWVLGDFEERDRRARAKKRAKEQEAIQDIRREEQEKQRQADEKARIDAQKQQEAQRAKQEAKDAFKQSREAEKEKDTSRSRNR